MHYILYYWSHANCVAVTFSVYGSYLGYFSGYFVKATFAGPPAPHLDMWQYPVDNIRELQTPPPDDANGTMF